MGPGTVTLRFMMDDLRQTTDPTTSGFPLAGDVAAVAAYLATMRPVAIRDFYVVAPIPEPIDYTVHLSPDTPSLRAATEVSVAAMLQAQAKPASSNNGVGQAAQTIYAAWVSNPSPSRRSLQQINSRYRHRDRVAGAVPERISPDSAPE
jgi:hypothetical protein